MNKSEQLKKQIAKETSTLNAVTDLRIESDIILKKLAQELYNSLTSPTLVTDEVILKQVNDVRNWGNVLYSRSVFIDKLQAATQQDYERIDELINAMNVLLKKRYGDNLGETYGEDNSGEA
jgi:hypothetical protein